MDVLFLSRLQFAATTMFHFLFVPLTLGLSILVAYMETRYVRTGDKTYLEAARDAAMSMERVAEERGDQAAIAEAYVEAVVQKRQRDPVLSFQLRNGFEVIGVIPHYLDADGQSLGYGVHLVYIQQREAASIYPFAEVRQRVKNDYLFELRQARNEEMLEKLKTRYEITIAPY